MTLSTDDAAAIQGRRRPLAVTAVSNNPRMASTGIDHLILAAAAKNDGSVSRAELLELGVSSASVTRRVRNGVLRRVIAGHYIVPVLASPTSSAAAVLLAHPSGAIARSTAARRHGFPMNGGGIELVVDHGTNLRVEGLTIHETRHLPEPDVLTIDGIPHTSPARTLCDLAPGLMERRLIHLLETQLSRRSPAPSEMLDCWQRRYRRRVRGMAHLGRVLSELIDDDPFPESELEIQLIRGLSEIGLTGLRHQYRPPWYDGVRGIVDFADPAGLTIIECDGRRHRQVTQAHDEDRRRDRLASLHGWATIRIGWRELISDRMSAIAQIAEIVRLRRSSGTDATSSGETAA